MHMTGGLACLCTIFSLLFSCAVGPNYKRPDAQAEAIGYARRVTELDRVRYDAGVITYLDVVDAERSQLEQERAAVRIGGSALPPPSD